MRIAPIFPVADLTAALEHYRRLGFAVRTYEKGGYGFAARDDVELHLGVAQSETPASAYLFVDDADELAREWGATGADVRPPVDTEWGQREGVVLDPDGNIIRFGSPLPESDGAVTLRRCGWCGQRRAAWVHTLDGDRARFRVYGKGHTWATEVETCEPCEQLLQHGDDEA